ncbi:hypothetical protein KFU94_60210 [Chloroflexi bacterium TSY]|nr:hypothetical protein [Chloroflexi bacterium TSY]
MQATAQRILNELSADGVAPAMGEEEARRLVDSYLKAEIGPLFEAAEARFIAEINEWSFSIKRCFPDLDAPAGHLRVRALSGEVVPLSDKAIWEMRASTLVFAEHRRGNNPARGEDGLILPYQAKIKANAYMGDTVAFFVRAEAGPPTLIPGRPPLWRVKTVLHLRDYGTVADMGTVDVNAVSSQVIPLSESEINTKQEQARHAALRAQCKATPAS